MKYKSTKTKPRKGRKQASYTFGNTKWERRAMKPTSKSKRKSGY